MKILLLRVCLTLLVGLIIASVSQWFMEKRVKAEIGVTQIEFASSLITTNYNKYK